MKFCLSAKDKNPERPNFVERPKTKVGLDEVLSFGARQKIRTLEICLLAKDKKETPDFFVFGRKTKIGRDGFVSFAARQKSDGMDFYLSPKDEKSAGSKIFLLPM
jgi:hypothetical protein